MLEENDSKKKLYLLIESEIISWIGSTTKVKKKETSKSQEHVLKLQLKIGK